MNLDKIKDIYGEEIYEDIINNRKLVMNNINYLNSKNITIIEDIVDRYGIILLYEENDFNNKIDSLINKIGDNYIEELENNVDLLEELL